MTRCCAGEGCAERVGGERVRHTDVILVAHGAVRHSAHLQGGTLGELLVLMSCDVLKSVLNTMTISRVEG